MGEVPITCNGGIDRAAGVSWTEALVVASEGLSELKNLCGYESYEEIMVKLDISDAYFQEVVKELSWLAGTSIEGGE